MKRIPRVGDVVIYTGHSDKDMTPQRRVVRSATSRGFSYDLCMSDGTIIAWTWTTDDWLSKTTGMNWDVIPLCVCLPEGL